MIQPSRKPGIAWDFERLATTTVRVKSYARNEGASRDATMARVDLRVGDGRDGPGSVAGNWPYLAI